MRGEDVVRREDGVKEEDGIREKEPTPKVREGIFFMLVISTRFGLKIHINNGIRPVMMENPL